MSPFRAAAAAAGDLPRRSLLLLGLALPALAASGCSAGDAAPRGWNRVLADDVSLLVRNDWEHSPAQDGLALFTDLWREDGGAGQVVAVGSARTASAANALQEGIAALRAALPGFRVVSASATAERSGTAIAYLDVASTFPDLTGGRLWALAAEGVCAVVLLGAFVVTFPSLRGYLSQQAQYDAIVKELDRARATSATLEAELAQWQDDDYVRSQARERLSYVMPGETTYVVVGAEQFEDEAEHARVLAWYQALTTLRRNLDWSQRTAWPQVDEIDDVLMVTYDDIVVVANLSGQERPAPALSTVLLSWDPFDAAAPSLSPGQTLIARR